MMKKLLWAVIILILLVITVKSSTSYYIVGEQHLTKEQNTYFHAALEKPCNGRIILLTPYPNHRANGWAYGPLIKIYSVWQWKPIELYCLVRHECMEKQIPGTAHDWTYIWEECRNELRTTH